MKGRIIVQNCDPPAPPSTLTVGDLIVCPNGEYTYAVAPVSGATSYTWLLPGDWTGTSSSNSIEVTSGITSGSLLVSANNACGSSLPLSIGVTVTLIDTSVTAAGITLTANETGATYQWIRCDDFSVIPGETGQQFTATINGVYAVVVSENGCVDTSSCHAITSVGIVETTGQDWFYITPNPSGGVIQIIINYLYLNDNVNLEIYDVTGKLVSSVSEPQTDTLIDLSSFRKGLYFLRLQSGKRIITSTLMLQ